MHANIRISDHLLWSELACKDRLKTPVPVDLRHRAGWVAVEFEVLRHECGDVPLTVLSGYRTPEYNATVPNAAPTSQHCAMRALDVACPESLTFEAFKDAARRTAGRNGSKIRRLIWYPSKNFIHLDIRPSNTLKEWTA